jgi:3-isopropylmalate dehydrogenase
MQKTIAVLPGDGIGEEVMEQALRVLVAISEQFGHGFNLKHGSVGGAAFEKFGSHFPEETKKLCEESDAILFGSVGGPVADMHLAKWKNCEANSILAIRKAFGFNANFRPVRIYPQLGEISPLRQDLIERGVDILFIRELLGDCYFGTHQTELRNGRRYACDLSEYTEEQIASVARIAFDAARRRKNKVTSVDKANVLDTSKLWRTVVSEIKSEYPDVHLEHMLVDNCAMQIIRDPSQFDVVVTSNMFGDILSDAAAVLPGSLGLLCSASLNPSGFALYEPPGGSAQDIAGQGIANPIAQILSVAMLLRFSFGLNVEANAIEQAVETTLANGYRTRDIYRGKSKLVGSVQMTDEILGNLSTVGAKATLPVGTN